MYYDTAKIIIKAGNGGDGHTSFLTLKYINNGGPDGGDGGNGGSVIFVADKDIRTLNEFHIHRKYHAENGENGGKRNCYGKCGEDLYIKVPVGTIVKDFETDGILADMFYDKQEEIIQKGGKGGKGNAKFKSATRQAPSFAQTGEKTKEIALKLELKSVADVGLVGYPNAGKSTLLSVLTNAKPKIASYQFTTLEPNLGICAHHDDTCVIADIPGLIEGASKGVGLGFNFLRHIERTRMLVHIVDMSGLEGRSPIDDYKTIRNELKEYRKELAELPFIIVANKMDIEESKNNLVEFKKEIKGNIVEISAIRRENLDELKNQIFDLLKDLPEVEPIKFVKHEYDKEDKESFMVYKNTDGSFTVEGGLIDSLTTKVVLNNQESFRYFQDTLKRYGVIDKLHELGMKDGDLVIIGDIEFENVE